MRFFFGQDFAAKEKLLSLLLLAEIVFYELKSTNRRLSVDRKVLYLNSEKNQSHGRKHATGPAGNPSRPDEER